MRLINFLALPDVFRHNRRIMQAVDNISSSELEIESIEKRLSGMVANATDNTLDDYLHSLEDLIVALRRMEVCATVYAEVVAELRNMGYSKEHEFIHGPERNRPDPS